MSKDPLISIITVNLNDLKGLQRTMKSIFRQTWQDFEYIIIDGGSTDGSEDYLEKYAEKVDYWVSEKDSGIYNAMNKGIKKASGEYLLFLNSGDELYTSNVLKENYKYIRDYDLIYFDIQMISKEKTYIHRYPKKLAFEFFQRSALGHPTTFINKDLFKTIGVYDESLKIVSDWKFFMTAVVKEKCSYKKIDKVLSKFYKDGISSLHKDFCDEERKKVLKSDFKMQLYIFQIKMFIYRLRTKFS